ncbi:L-serine ammonia-lyase [Leifsonia shinshuensis]|uniref:L-serine ammonia-lyase n=1 Tax=Leifsonia shinshuensis TaxID=150026 RepID=UPI001F50B76C|nr:L-serine ammonia-lyase [Leifsonia shinshuensis]MCI0157799.1 L-serine ammonia-lyase [Leifsonia shinshuensis]
MTYAQQTVGVFDLFTVGIGPSSSHTVGPMKAAAAFADSLEGDGLIDRVAGLRVEVFGSLAATGAGHGTFTAVLLGLAGARSDEITPDEFTTQLDEITRTGMVELGGRHPVPCRIEDFVLRPLTVHPRHPNALSLTAVGGDGEPLSSHTYFSVGGGFIVREGEEALPSPKESPTVPLPFRSGAELLAICDRTGLSVSDVMRENERALRSDSEVRASLRHIWDVMEASVRSSLGRSGTLPGGLGVRRRARAWAARLDVEDPNVDSGYWQQRVNLIALAVNEENASGGRVVTAPTNGAAGIVPAVLYYALHYTPAAQTGGDVARGDIIERFLLAAGAIGTLYKANASISGAEVGCQGEVGSASSMAAAGLAEVLGGSPRQVENAAEIAMEHNLGLTCDPIGGLVQIPCIERNAIAASKAINAARMALWGDGDHRVSLDQVIATMRETGADMSDKYKETALGGLAVNVVEC